MSVTIKDIAKKAGVSFSTVSKALRNSPLVNEETKRRVIQIATEMGYQPNMAARNLVSKRSSSIGIVWPTVERIAPTALMKSIISRLEKEGYTSIFSLNRADAAIRSFQRFQVDAILVFYDRDEAFLKMTPSDISIPILYNGIGGSSPFPTIDLNRKKAIKTAVEKLIQLGHTKIGWIGDYVHFDPLQQEKVAAFRNALRKERLPIREEWILPIRGLEAHDGYFAARTLLEGKELPTAIVSGSYDLTKGILQALMEYPIKIPEELSLISYDHIPQMETLPIPITAVGVPLSMIAGSIVSILLSLINDPQKVDQVTFLEPEILIRRSIARPRKG